jgi:hypothetical protein
VIYFFSPRTASFAALALTTVLAGILIFCCAKSSVYLEHHCAFLNSGTSATAGKLNSTTIKGYKQILGKFGEIQREFLKKFTARIRITIAAEAAVVINTSTRLAHASCGSVASL